jgi:predicted polyphosphate/ATP-dependent NAD kinase
MTTVGIIANPAAGKDIRRLVAHASVFDNNEKVNIVRRVLLGLEATGVQRVLLMPDYFDIGGRALHGLHLALPVAVVDMPTGHGEADSTLAAARLREMGAGCIVTLGGDGTNRAVAKGCGAVPLVPISTGTNNVFPTMIEGTIAGLAAGLVARGIVDELSAVRPTLRLEVLRDEDLVDLALIDAVVYDGRFIGSRAIWNADGLLQVVLARAEPYSIGLSSIGGVLAAVDLAADEGLAIEVGPGELRVLAPIAPGLIRPIGIKSHRRLKVGDSVAVQGAPIVLALDGERSLALARPEPMRIRLSADGPRVVDIRTVMKQAARLGFFVQSTERARSVPPGGFAQTGPSASGRANL